MIPRSPKCPACSHPAIRAARKCKMAMALFNDGKTAEAETLLEEAIRDVRGTGLPMMQAKLLNSLGMVYSRQNRTRKAERALAASLRIIAGRIGTENRLYERVAANLHSLAA